MSALPIRPLFARGALDPARYKDYRLWLERCVHRLEREHGSAAKRIVAQQIGCTAGHLGNILAGRRALGSPYLENLILAFGLNGPQTRALLLLVQAQHGALPDRVQAAEALEVERGVERGVEPGQEAPELSADADDGPLHLLSLEALSLRGVVNRGPLELAAILLPPTAAPAVGRLTMQALSRGPEPLTPGLRALAPLEPAGVPGLLDGLRRARYALEHVPLGQRLLRFSIGVTPMGCWNESFGAALAEAQEELARFALHQPLRGAPCAVFQISAQVTPLSRPLVGEGEMHAGGLLSLGTVVHTGDEEGPSPSGAVAPAPAAELPRTFAYDDYRAYLRAWFARRREQAAARGKTFTMNQVARRAGFNAGILSHLLSGHRHLPEVHLEGLIRGLRLEGEEVRDLPLLWRYTLATGPGERAALLLERRGFVGFREARPAAAAAMGVLASPAALSVLELARHPSFQADEGWIRERLLVRASSEELRAHLRDLLAIGALRPDAEGRPRPVASHLWLESATHRDLMSALHLANLDHVGRVARTEPALVWRAAQAVVLPLLAQDELVERVRQLHLSLERALQQAAAENPGESTEIRLLTLQLVPGTREFKP